VTGLLVPILRGAQLKAWPKHEQGGVAQYVKLEDALARSFFHDAHFAQYSCPSMARRLDGKALTSPYVDQLGGAVEMTLLVFDVDGPKHEATDEWRREQRTRVNRLLEVHAGVYMYETRHGYRLLVRLAEPMRLTSPESADEWSAYYCRNVAYLKRVFGIEADAVKDWTRLFRAPHATRDEGARPENLPSMGDENAVGVWITPEFTPEDIEAAGKIGKKPKKTPQLRIQPQIANYNGRGIIGRLLRDDGLLGDEVEPDVWIIKCPLDSEHTTGEPFDGKVRYYAPTSPGHTLGTIVDLHTGHGHDTKSSKEWLDCWPQHRIDAAREAEGLPEWRPPEVRAVRKINGAAVPIDFDELEPQHDQHWGQFTDLGNAERFIKDHRLNVRYCPPKKKWLIYGDGWWRWDETGEAIRLGQQTIRNLYRVAADCPDDRQRHAYLAHAKKSESTGAINAMLTAAAPHLSVMPEALDSDPWLICVANGVINRAGELVEHAREYLMTRHSDVVYDPDATSEIWQQYLDTATNNDKQLQQFLKRVAGYLITGSTIEKCFFILHGPKNTGKSVFLDVLLATMGTYAQSAAFSTWCVQKYAGGNRGDLVRLAGARLVISTEVAEGRKFDSEIIKPITGGDKLCYAAKFESEVEFWAQFKLMLAVNVCPAISEDDDALFSRVRRIPWNVVIPYEKQDRYLRDKLRHPEVLSAILAWAVQGLREYLAMGELGSCAVVEASNAQYRSENDQTKEFIDTGLDWFAAYTCNATEFRSYYESWCRQQGIKYPISAHKMRRRLETNGATYIHGRLGWYWKGFRLYASEPADDGQWSSEGKEPQNTTSREVPAEDMLFSDFYTGARKGEA
jgi:P4 family phage/plasmid primase-like protien